MNPAYTVLLSQFEINPHPKHAQGKCEEESGMKKNNKLFTFKTTDI